MGWDVLWKKMRVFEGSGGTYLFAYANKYLFTNANKIVFDGWLPGVYGDMWSEFAVPASCHLHLVGVAFCLVVGRVDYTPRCVTVSRVALIICQSCVMSMTEC